MSNVEELQANEIALLSEEEELLDLETLINDGAKAKIPITVKFPLNGELVNAGAFIKPITITELNNIVRLMQGKKSSLSNIYIEILKIGLLTKNQEPFPKELIEQLPAGVAEEIGRHIFRVSGISPKQEGAEELAKRLLGF